MHNIRHNRRIDVAKLLFQALDNQVDLTTQIDRRALGLHAAPATNSPVPRVWR
jgi:hypothetical protein